MASDRRVHCRTVMSIRLWAAITRRSAAVRGARAARRTAWVTAVRRTSSAA